MNLDAVLARRKAEMTGKPVTAAESEVLRNKISAQLIPTWLLDALMVYPIVGTRFRFSEEQDHSGLGVDMRWLTPAQTISEAIEAYPGIPASVCGYLPIGMCLQGSGDPYFLKMISGDDPPVVRIPHQAVRENKLLEDQVELVTEHLSTFLDQAKID